jgi:hypothetical protein
VIGAVDLSQSQFVLRKALLFYLNGRFPATSFAGRVLLERRRNIAEIERKATARAKAAGSASRATVTLAAAMN